MFLVIATILGIGVFIYYSAIHTFLSSMSSSIGIINPRYLIMGVGMMYLIGFTAGVVFLGFDIRARDVRECIYEVLDSRPITNLELVSGRFLGLFLCIFVPLSLLFLFLQFLGWLLPLAGSPLGRTMEPVSLISFLFLQAIPCITFSITVVFLITLLVRNRMVAAVGTIMALVGMFWAQMVIAPQYNQYLDYMGLSTISFPSDLVISMLNPGGGLQRLGIFILSTGLLCLTAAIHPRLDGNRRSVQYLGSIAVVILGFLSLTIATQIRNNIGDDMETWYQAHKARVDGPVADVQSISGTIRIAPGDSLTAELQLHIKAPGTHGLDSALFTLNPGMAVAGATSANGEALTLKHENGLLEIQLGQSIGPGENATVNLEYSGSPELNFAYLDSVIKFSELEQQDANIALLGYINGFFDSRFIALMPGIYWLPISGVDIDKEDTRTRQRDYFDLDLIVELPEEWIVAGPGKRKVLEPGPGKVRYRFDPETDIAEVALVASKFKSFSTEVKGITFEVLVHPDHDSNFETMSHTRDEIELWIQDFLDIAEDAGLKYPFDAFTMVEVPISLRGFGGGWRLNTTLSPPAMLLVRENGFPTARFDFDGEKTFEPDDIDPSLSDAEWDRNRLIRFFYNDVTGGNLFQSVARSFFAHRTSATGPDAIALNFATEQLATRLISGERSYFSAHLFTSLQTNIQNIMLGAAERANVDTLGDIFVTALTAKPQVWDAILNTPMTEIDPWDDPQRTIDMLTLKGGEMAEAIYDSLGPKATGRILANILDKHAGGAYTRADVIAAASEVDNTLGPMLNDWFTSTKLPGFVADNVRLYQLPDSDNGDSVYQYLVRIRNDEPVAGFARVTWYFEAFGEEFSSDPIRVDGNSAVEFGVVTSKPLVSTHLEPYLSLNREGFNIKILNREEIPKMELESFSGVRQVAWDSGNDDRIYADDLDAGFTIIKEGEERKTLRLAGRNFESGTDNGLPVGIGPIAPAEWSRRLTLLSWGRYRHTTAYIRSGDGINKAVMPATIPEPGTWQLEIYIPWLNFINAQQRGTWHLDIVSDYGRENIDYDATVGDFGWNLVGEFELPAGEVKVEFSDKTNGRVVMADAIAWSPIRINSSNTGQED